MHLDCAVVTLDDLMRDSEAESLPFAYRLGREERIEESRHVSMVDPTPVIADRNAHAIINVSCPDCDGASIADRIECVRKDVHEHLVDLSGRTFDRWDGRILLDHIDVSSGLYRNHR